MPRAYKQCGVLQCTTRVRGQSYCDAHKKDKQWQGSTWSDDLDRNRWNQVRSFVILRDGGHCYVCNAPYCTIVDHKFPVILGGARYDPENCGPICQPCHEKKTATDGRVLPIK